MKPKAFVAREQEKFSSAERRHFLDWWVTEDISFEDQRKCQTRIFTEEALEAIEYLKTLCSPRILNSILKKVDMEPYYKGQEYLEV